MIFTYKPSPPPLPFPTAFPGLGITLSNPVSGQHASNPTPYRFNTIHPRRSHLQSPQHPYWKQVWSRYVPNPQCTVYQQDRMNQTWLTRIWTQTLSPTQRTAWATFAAAHTLTNVFGQTKHLSPFGAFLHVNRLYIVGWSLPGRPPASTDPCKWPSPPAAWNTLTNPNLKNFAIRIGQPPTLGYPTPFWLFWIEPTYPLGLITPEVVIFCSYPHKTITALKQGPMFLTAQVAINFPYNFKGYIYSQIYHPALHPGQSISVAYSLLDYNTGGQSPTTWTQLTATTYP